MLKELIKNSFNRTNNCIILAGPLVIIISMVSVYASYVLSNAIDKTQIFISLLSILFMLSACFSAWFYMSKKAINLSQKIFVFDNDRNTELINLFSYLPTGISKYFLSFLVIFLLYGLIFGSMGFYLYDVVSNNVFHNVHVDSIFIDLNLIYTFVVLSLLHFFLLFWVPEVIYIQKNPFKALIGSLKKIWLSLPKSLALFIYLLVFVYVIKALDIILLTISPYFYFLVLLLGYYLAVYIVVVVFSYYEKSFVK